MRFICGIIACLFLWCVPVSAESVSEPVISAEAAILIEASSGRVIYEKNAARRMYPASMTKIMTCLLALEYNSPNSVVTISPHVETTEDSYLGLATGERLTLDNLLKALMLVSDNGAAVAIAEAVDGSVDAFAAHMNKKAADIGCSGTNFANPNGLPDNNHYSTAYDMALIAAHAMERRDFRDIVDDSDGTVEWLNPPGKTVLIDTTNELLHTYAGADGIKTGWTNSAGGCLAASAKRKGIRLIAIVMNAPDVDARFTEAARLLDYGFTKVKSEKTLPKERVGKIVWVQNGLDYRVRTIPTEDITYPMLEGDKDKDYSLVYNTPQFIVAPVTKGEKIGTLDIMYRSKKIRSIDMVAETDVADGFDFLSYILIQLIKIFI